MTGRPVLEVSGVRTALSDARWCGLSVTLGAGDAIQLAGPSGSGKTSICRAIARLQPLTQGRMRLRGSDAAEVPPTAWRRSIAFLPQRPAMLPGTVEDNLRAAFTLSTTSGARYDAGRAAQLLDRVRLARAILEQDARSLSGGEASRLTLVRALLLEPDVLLLDEITAALDSEAAEAVVDLVSQCLSEAQHACLIVAHHPEPWHQLVSGEVALEVGP